MKKFRLSFAFLLLALVLAAVPAAFAQDSTFGASAEDYALWTAANESLAATSARIDFSVTIAGTGIGDDGADVTADVTGTGAFDTSNPDNPILQLDVTGTADGEDVNLNLRIVDGTVYTNDGDGWKKSPLEDEMSEITGSFGDMTGGMDPSDLSADSAMSMFAGIEEFFSLTSSQEDGLTKFVFSIDIPGLISSPMVSGMLAGALGMGGGEEISDAQMEQMGQMMGMMFGEAEVSIDEYVDAESQTLSRATFNIDFPLEAVLGTPGAGLVVTVDANFSNYGEPVSVEAPEGAVESSS